MVLIPNNNLLVYTNSTTDPYTNGNGGTMLTENINNCNTVIGSANFDIGHVFSTGGGGVAGLGVVCGASKARGVTGSSNPVGDPFDIDYVAHEMGHQFAGNHTFNSSTGSCSGNQAASAAYEPGSGITIMAYAGICGSDNLASNSIAYFHTKSFDEIVIFSTTGNGNTCPATTATGNTPPVVTSMGANYSIPISTPFILTGAANDGGNPITYSWEQYDLGTAGAWNANLANAPIFRPFTPTTSASRTFPKISDIINNVTTVGEILPNVARTMNFRLTVRDNQAAGGGVTHPDTTVIISVINGGGAFAVTAPNTAVSWAGGSTQTVSWNVSGTTAAPISTANVKISLSTDGGNTFPTVIVASTANDGTESISVPNVASTQARIKVEAVGNIYFDMSNANFTITSSAFSTITTSSIVTTNYCAGTSLNVSFTTNGSANAGNIFKAQLSNAAGSFANPDSIGSLTSTTSGIIACTIPAGTVTGTGYRIRVVSSNPVVTGSDNGANLTISGQVGAAGAPQTGSSAYCANLPIVFTTSAITNATSYNWSVNAGGVITNGQGTAQVTIAFPPGQPTTTATVSVFGSNANCSGTTGSLNVTIQNTPNTPTANGASGCSGTAINLSGFPAAVPGTTIASYSVPNPYTGPATTFTYTLTTPFGCNSTSASAFISVIPLPTVTATNVSGCAGSPISLLGSPAGGSFNKLNPYLGPSTTYTYTYTNGNGCTNTSAAANITVNPLPVVTANNVVGCEGSPITLTGSPAGGTFNLGNPYTGPSTQYTYFYTNANGCSNTSAPATITANPLPTVTAANVSGCEGSPINLAGSPAGGSYSVANPYTGPSTTYSYTYTNGNGCSNTAIGASITSNPSPVIAFNLLATSYNISAAAVTLTGTPAGGSFSGPGVSGNTFTPSLAGAGGPYTITYSYTDGNGCSSTSSQSTSVINCTLPSMPSTIATVGGTVKVCPGSTVTYRVTNVATVSFYIWIPPTGGTIISGQGTNQVVVSYSAAFTASGALTVAVNNSCGSSLIRSLTITRNTPATPGVVTGQVAGLCGLSGVPYSVTPVSGITYNWSFNAATAVVGSGQGTNAITANFLAGYITGNIQVSATNACGTSALRSLTVKTTPPVATAISGTSTTCANQFGVPYSISPLATATTYTWSVPTGAKINDGTVTSTSTTLVTTSTAVTVNFATTAGSVKVRGNNACGSASYFSKAVTFTCRVADDTNQGLALSFYPVPANEILNITFESTIETTNSIRLTNLLGKDVIVQSGTSTIGTNQSEMDLSAITPGVYFLEVVNGSERKVEKIIVE
ncbi:MAG: T9SS type A sorting domain-containing protein [Bacteroidetes bacterium]|nr:T9SS type A sorting domain-containing protein [Bacteroidota bacterium]